MKKSINYFSKESYNLLSNFFKIAGKSLWQFFIPYVLSISVFNTYSLLQNISSVLIHTTNLGSRQIILRSYNYKVPLFKFTVHSFLLLTFQLPIIGYSFNIPFVLIIFVGLIIFATNLYNNYSAALRSLMLFKQIFIIEFIGFVSFAVVSLLLLKLKPSIVYILIIESIVFLIISILLIINYQLRSKNILESKKSLKEFLPSIYNVGFVVIADAVIWKFVPLYFLLKINDEQPNIAIFNLSLLLANAFVLIPQSILEAWTPQLSELFSKKGIQNTSVLKDKINTYTKIFVVIICISFLVCYLSFTTIYSKYLIWAHIMIGFILFRIILSFSDFYVCVLYSLKKEKLLFSPTIISSIVLVCFTFFTYKSNGLIGVMFSFLMSKLVFGYFVFLNYRKTISL